MKIVTKKIMKIYVASIFTMVIFCFLFSVVVHAQTQGYSRSGSLNGLSGGNLTSDGLSSNSSVSGSGLDSSNSGGWTITDIKNTFGASLPTTPIQIGESNLNTPNQVQIYHPDPVYEKWVAEAKDIYQKYGGEGSEYENAITDVNQKYFGQDFALPPASYYSTENGTSKISVDVPINPSDSKSSGRSAKDKEILKYYNVEDTRVLSSDLQDQFLQIIHNYENTDENKKDYYKQVQPFLDAHNLCNDEELNMDRDCVNSFKRLSTVVGEPTNSTNNIDSLKSQYDAQLSKAESSSKIEERYGAAVIKNRLSSMIDTLQSEIDVKIREKGIIDAYKWALDNLNQLNNQVLTSSTDKSTDQIKLDKVTLAQKELTESDIIAQSLGYRPLAVDPVGNTGIIGKDMIKVLPAGVLPPLAEGDVVVSGAPTIATTHFNTTDKTEVRDTYYIVNKYAISNDYVLINTNNEIDIGGAKGKGSIVFDEDTVVTYNLVKKDNAVTYDTQKNVNGKFNFNFENSAVSGSMFAKIFNKIASTVTGNDAILGHLALRDYAKSPDITLAKFGTFAKDLSTSLSQEQKERSIYDYVNNELRSQNANVSSVSVNHTLEQAVALRQGVCRDKSAALEYALTVAGIPAARVISDSHIFVAVLNSDKTVNHYLDPMYYETYLPLQRSNVKMNQMIYNNYGKSNSPVTAPKP
ncbi:MAG: hypothetical protein WCP15_01490 [bacterium]